MKNIQRIISYTRPYWIRSCIAITSACFFGAISSLPAALMKYSIDDLFIQQNYHLIVPFLVVFLTIFFLKSLFMYLTSYNLYWVTHRSMNDLKIDLFKKIIYFSPVSLKKEKSGVLLSRFLNDISMIQIGITSAIKEGVRSIFEAFFLIGFAFFQQPKLALVLFLLAPILSNVIMKMGKARKKASATIQEKSSAVATLLQESFSGIREIKVLSGEEKEIARLRIFLKNTFTSLMDNAHLESICPAVIESISMLFASGTMYWAIMLVLNGTLSPGQLASFIGALILAYQPIKKISSVYSDIFYSLGAAERVFALMDQEKKSTQKRELTASSDKLVSGIYAENLSFSYGNIFVLQKISFFIPRGSRIGIIGPSGSGKSTLVDLLLGFISPTTGSLLIDNTAADKLSSESLNKLFGYVSQAPFLFNDTIYNNVTYGQPNITEEDVIKACKLSAIHDFIIQQPLGYNSIVGENGSLLSGGQKQRIAIARALIKKPPILLLDEATSALDEGTERSILQALLTLSLETTLLIVTHRPILLEAVQTLFILENGSLQIKQKEFSIMPLPEPCSCNHTF